MPAWGFWKKIFENIYLFIKKGGVGRKQGVNWRMLVLWKTCPLGFPQCQCSARGGCFLGAIAISYAPFLILRNEKTLPFGNVLVSVCFGVSHSVSVYLWQFWCLFPGFHEYGFLKIILEMFL